MGDFKFFQAHSWLVSICVHCDHCSYNMSPCTVHLVIVQLLHSTIIIAFNQSHNLQGKISDFPGRQSVYVLSYAGPAISYLFIGISSTAICLVTARVIPG